MRKAKSRPNWKTSISNRIAYNKKNLFLWYEFHQKQPCQRIYFRESFLGLHWNCSPAFWRLSNHRNLYYYLINCRFFRWIYCKSYEFQQQFGRTIGLFGRYGKFRIFAWRNHLFSFGSPHCNWFARIFALDKIFWISHHPFLLSAIGNFQSWWWSEILLQRFEYAE